MAYKVFTNGSVLTASEINENLMRQSVIVFSNATARAAAITSPNEGMLTWLEDVNRYESYNGSAWVSLSTAGLELIRTATLSGVSTLSLGSNADPLFSSTYDNYKVIFSSRNSTDVSRSYTLRMRANTTDESGLVYSLMAVGIDRLGSAANNFGINASSFTLANNAHYAQYPTVVTFDINAPFLADDTSFIGGSTGFNVAQSVHQTFAGYCVTNTSYNGITITNSSGNFDNGTIQIYGYKKA